MTGLAWWSQTAASNATQDPAINFAEGQSPSSINDSARALMASAAKWRDDIAGAILTTGSSTAYAVTSYQVFDSLARLSNQVIAFTPHVTNGATVTINVDGLGAKSLMYAPGIELPAGVLVQGTPYTCVYNNNSDSKFYLHGVYGNPYNIPLGGILPFVGSTAPNSSFVLSYGQAISRTTYATLFALTSTTYGAGDGSTTFNVPDLRGTVVAGVDNMGGVSGGRFPGLNTGTFQGAITHTLTVGELPAHTHSGTTGDDAPDHSHTVPNVAAVNSVAAGGGAGFSVSLGTTQSSGASARHVHPFTTNNGTGGGAAHSIVQPTLGLNYILRIL